jgi:3-(3-hydroxy-phenyl)propionate hydroxylase
VTAGGSYLLPTYPFRVPPELAGGEARRYPVVIVGGGLSGLTAACDLAVRGIETVLLDEDDTIGVRGASSRGIVYARKTLEVFRRLGIYERVAQKGVQWFVGRTLVNDEIVYEFDMKQVTSSEQPAFLNLQQFYVEWFLVDRIMELGRTDLRWKNKVIGVSPSKDFVSLDVETPAGRYTLQADWVIDASGLASVIRNGLGLQTHADKSTEDRWCITDVRFTKKLPQERWTWVEGEANEGRAIWQHPLADGVWRLDFQMAPNSDPAYVSREDVACDRLRRHLGEGVDFELVWVGPYSYRAHLLDDFRAGRVFFIGDSAHVVSPFGARGGNTGVQDAENLAWKLALVLRGQAPEVLLETYSEERYAAARTNLDVTRRSARFLAPRSAAERTLRNAVIALARRYPFARSMVNTGRLSAPHTYADSSLITTGGQAVQNVPLLLPDGQRGCLVDLVGDGFLVLWWQAAGMEMPKIPQARVVVVTPAMDMTGSLTRELSDGPGSAALIRPDLHLAARLPASRLGELSAALARAMKRSD